MNKSRTKKKIIVKKVVEKEKVEEKVVERKIVGYVATYIGPPTNMTLSGIGKIIPGKPFEVTEKIANALRFDSKNFTVKPKYE